MNQKSGRRSLRVAYFLFIITFKFNTLWFGILVFFTDQTKYRIVDENLKINNTLSYNSQ